MSALSRRHLLIAAAAATALPWAARAQVVPDWQTTPWQLMMVTKRGCYYCKQWRAQIGPGYPTSRAGRAAPMFEVDVDGPYPDALALDRRPRLTPTFIVLERGTERGRVEGYVGERYFYPVLEEVMVRAGLLAPA